MQRTPLQTLLAERLQSARGLGWEMPAPPTRKPLPQVTSRTRERSSWLLRFLGFAR